jgi:TolB protein
MALCLLVATALSGVAAASPPGAETPLAGDPADGSRAAQGWIAFIRLTDGHWQPWTARPDGSGLRRLARSASDATRITLNADGSRMLADCIDGSLMLLPSPGEALRAVSVEPGGATDATLSPDGRWIAYSVNTLGGIDANDLWLVGVEGGRARRLTDQPFLQHFPAWAAGSSEIYYLSGRGGASHDLWKVPVAPGGEPVPVLGERGYNFEPSASPDGGVAFSSNASDNYDVWWLDAGSSEPTRLTDDPAYDGQPSVSPDGRFVVFVSRRARGNRLWIHERSSGKEWQIPIEGEIRMPFWYAGSTPGAGKP